MAGRLVAQLVAQLMDRSVAQLMDRSVAQLVDWLMDPAASEQGRELAEQQAQVMVPVRRVQ